MAKALKIAEQVEYTKDLLVAGYRPGQIIKELKDKWGLSTSTSENRMRAAREEMLRHAKQIDRHQLGAQLFETYSEILRKARETNQLNNALGAAAGIARLTGLDIRQN